MNFRFPRSHIRDAKHSFLLLACLSLLGSRADAAVLTASDGEIADLFGIPAVWGNIFVVGAAGDDFSDSLEQGSAYVFRGDGAGDTPPQQVAKLRASDGAAYDYFGTPCVEENVALISAPFGKGVVYLFRNLNTVTGTVTEHARLVPRYVTSSERFGVRLRLSGNTAVVGAYLKDVYGQSYQGVAYIFRNLNVATGTVAESMTLMASDGVAYDHFGVSVGLSGSLAVVGAYGDDVTRVNQGSAYVFRGVNTGSGTVYQNAKLLASDPSYGSYFGHSVSVSGDNAVIGAFEDTINERYAQGSAYVFRGLSTTTGTVFEKAKLVASDGAAADNFGAQVALSGTNALVTAPSADVGPNQNQGAVYLFRDLNTAVGLLHEDVKLIASDGEAFDALGGGDLHNDTFVLGATGPYNKSSKGKSYTGSASSLTTLNTGNIKRQINGLSFISRVDWIVGNTTGENQVELAPGGVADVRAEGKAVYIGRNADSSNNSLIIKGSLLAQRVHVGSVAGNTGNRLVLETGATFGAVVIRLAAGNSVWIKGNHTSAAALLDYLDSAKIEIPRGDTWVAVDQGNFSSAIMADTVDGYTVLAVRPQAATFSSWIATHGLGATEALESADPDGDGIANLLEFAAGNDPTASGPQPVVVTAQTGTLTLSFPRSDESEATVSITVQSSNDLVTWENHAVGAASGTATGAAISILENGTHPDTVKVEVPATDRTFVRLILTNQE